MTSAETRQLMAVIKTAYPEFNRDLLDAEHKAARNLWHTMLEPHSYELCNAAIAKHIQQCKFAPKISEIIDIVKEKEAADDPYGFKRYPIDDEWQCRSWINLSENLGIPLKPWQIEIINRYSHLRQRILTSPQKAMLLEAT